MNSVFHSSYHINPTQKEVNFVVTQNGEYRFASVLAPIDLPDNEASQFIVWENALTEVNGETVSLSWYLGAQERLLIDYYKNIQLTIFSGLQIPNVDAQTLIDMGETYILSNGDKSAIYLAMKNALDTPTDNDILNLLLIFSILGRQAAGG